MKRELVTGQLFLLGLAVLGTVFLAVRLATQRRAPSDSRASPARVPSGTVIRELEDPRTRAATARRAGREKLREAVPLLRSYANDRDPDVRLACVEALGEIADPEAVYALRLRLFDGELEVQLAATKALGRLGHAPAATALKEALSDRDQRVRLAAIKALSTMPVPVAGDALVGVVTARDKEVAMRAAAAKALAGRSDATSADGLVRATHDESPAVRLAALHGLARSREPPALAALANALTDPDKAVRAAAGEAVGRAGKTILPYVEKALALPASLEARQEAMEVLVKLAGLETAQALIRVLDTLDESVRGEAAGLRAAVVKTLIGMGEPALEPLSRTAIYGRCGLLAKEAAAEVCVHLGKPAVEPITKSIVRWHVYPDPDELKIWVKALGEIGDPRAVPALNRALGEQVEGMDELVAEARRKIEAKSGIKLPPPVPDSGFGEAPAPRVMPK